MGQRPLFALLAYRPRDVLTGCWHFGHAAFSMRSRYVSLSPAWLRHGAMRVERLLAILGNALPVAPHAALHVNAVVGVADSTDVLDERLTLPAEALVLLASRFRVLRRRLRSIR